MFINGKYTPFSDTPFSDTPLFETPVSKKHPLVDTTNEGKAAKRRKVQATPSKSLNNSVFTQNSIYNKIIHTCSEKQKAGGKENKEKPKGFILAVTSEPECKESLPPATSSEVYRFHYCGPLSLPWLFFSETSRAISCCYYCC